VFIFGESSAVVTSANLTTSGLDSNIEVGIEVSSKEAIDRKKVTRNQEFLSVAQNGDCLGR